MDYLYGDSTPSPLKANFLEFLRDAIDFAVFALQSDERILKGQERRRAASAESEAELARLEAFIGTVSRSIEGAEKGGADSPTSLCATRLSSLVADAHRATIEDVRRRLTELGAQVDAEEAATRDATVEALAKLLAPHNPHEARTVTRVALEGGRYEAIAASRAAFGLEWTFELVVPDDALWAAPVRLDRIVPHFEIKAPQLSGWISKEVKIKPQRLERHLVIELLDDGTATQVKLRQETQPDSGFDIKVTTATGKVAMERIGPADDTAAGKFEADADDVAPIVDLVKKLRTAALDLKRGKLRSATFEEGDFRVQAMFTDFVEKLIGMMTPIVREISERSTSTNELIIRRALANDRREEIFVTRATLRDKYTGLAPTQRALFAPLGLDAPSRARLSSPPGPTAPVVRAELPASRPPPIAERVVPVPNVPKAPPVPTSAANPPAAALPPPPPPVIPPPKRSEPPPPPKSDEAAAKSPGAALPKTPEPWAPSSSAVPPKSEEEEASSDMLIPLDETPKPSSSDEVPSSRQILEAPREGGRNEVLASALKKILVLARNGRTDEAYDEYGGLYGSVPFADYRPEDQRQALRLMVLAKSPPPPTDATKAAYRKALERIDVLVAALNEPVDLELLGAAHAYLGNVEAAQDAFKRGLEIERGRNPGSDLCGNLMRRLSAI